MRTSLTDTEAWRGFCTRAARDLSLLDSDDPVLGEIVGGRRFAEGRYRLIGDRLDELFGPLDGMRVLEIGGGYGGMAAELARRGCQVGIVDLPEARALQRAYLASAGVELAKLGDDPFQIGFSAYALSECRADFQTDYARMLARCPHGYIVWNGWIHDDGLTRDQLKALLPRAHWIGEIPRSHELNDVLAWGIR